MRRKLSSQFWFRVDKSDRSVCSSFIGMILMPRRATAIIALVAVIVHCVIGCCVRCVNACELVYLDASHANCCTCCDAHARKRGVDLCCQPATNSSLAEETTEHGEHDCRGCGSHKCPFILSESPAIGLNETLLSPARLDGWNASLTSIAIPSSLHRRSRRCLALPNSQGDLRLHLCLAVLTL